jgi:hypothetical protein
MRDIKLLTPHVQSGSMGSEYIFVFYFYFLSAEPAGAASAKPVSPEPALPVFGG